METLRLSRATHQLVERGGEALEKIDRELERYDDLFAFRQIPRKIARRFLIEHFLIRLFEDLINCYQKIIFGTAEFVDGSLNLLEV